MKLTQKLRIFSELDTLSDVLYLYLLRSNLYRILERSIKDTIIRKLIKLEIQKSPEFREHHLDLKYVRKLFISIMKPQILSKSIGLDHPSVRKVIEIAEEIMSKNKLLNVENLYNLAKKRLNLSRNRLLIIIQFLINKKILIERSKFSRETVLLNSIRRNIYNYIRVNPGVHFSLLRKKALSVESGSSGQLVWHLEMLLKFNYLNRTKVGNYTIFFPIEMDVELGIINFLLRDRINLKIIELLATHKSIKKSEIYKSIDEKRELVNYRINNLIFYELIHFENEHNKELCINPDKLNNIFDIVNNFREKLNKTKLK